MEELKKRLEEFFQRALEYRPYFKRKLYAKAFQECFDEQKELLTDIMQACEKAEDTEAVIDELASAIPDYARGRMKAEKSRRKRKIMQVDYNMNMVTFVVPVMIYNENKNLNALADRMIEKWNADVSTLQIGKGSFEELNKGFRSGLCYITTAVCESQNKPDPCYELTMLRDYRDGYLLQSDGGKELVEEYYDIAPTIVNRINRQSDAKEIYQDIYDTYLSRCVSLIENGKNEECRRVYTDMVHDLQTRFTPFSIP